MDTKLTYDVLDFQIIATQSAREQQKYGKAGAVAEEVLSCIKTIQSFGGEQREIKRLVIETHT
jgi:ABC-type multidrug transport system fused ATPase/permease subunit